MFTEFASARAIARGRLFKPSTGARGVVHCAGHGAAAFAYVEADFANVKALTDAGRPVAGVPTGNHWGNATGQALITDTRTHAISNWGFISDPIDLIGGSGGGCLALNWARANPSLVRRIVLIIPAVSIQDIYDNNRGGYASSIASAYSGGRPPDAFNPASNAEDYADIPITCWYSTNDPICNAQVIEDFCDAAGAEAISLGAVGHSAIGLDAGDVADFLS